MKRVMKAAESRAFRPVYRIGGAFPLASAVLLLAFAVSGPALNAAASPAPPKKEDPDALPAPPKTEKKTRELDEMW